MIDVRIKDRAWWEEYFLPGGGWEKNGGRRQTRIFAEHFSRFARIDSCASFSMLDAGCALGEAIKHFSMAYPDASLYGIDFSETAIDRCKKECGSIATFSVCGIDQIEGHFDIIHCSNTLEHFADFDLKAKHLINHCDRLFVLVPYGELSPTGGPLTRSETVHHQHTFYRDSFDFLLHEGLAGTITTRVFSCPGAWGWTRRQFLEQQAKNLFRFLIGRPLRHQPRQILYDIMSKNCPHSADTGKLSR